jgi:hypothetical protein
MDKLTPDELDEFLSVLASHHVTQFSCPAFALTMELAAPTSAADPELADAIRRRQTAKVAPKGMYSHASLWSGGSPPEFPGRATAPVSPAPSKDA